MAFSTTDDARAAFRHPAFRRFQAARFLLTVAFQIQSLAVAWQVYEITRRPLDLGFTGLAQFIPMASLALLGGAAADRYDRARVLTTALAVVAGCAATLCVLSTFSAGVAPILAVIAVFGACRAFTGPAAASLLPRLVPERDFANAVAWHSTTWQIATIVGPALGGLLYGWFGGAPGVYATSGVLTLTAIGLLRRLGVPTAPTPQGAARWSNVLEGLHFVRSNPIVASAMTLDLFAVLLGGAVALLPIFAKDILGTDPTGLGLLRSAPAIGAALTAIFLAYRPIRRNSGRTLLISVAIYGVATIAFGLSTSFAAAWLALLVVGGADMISVVVRQTLLQLHTPDAMRGRVSAVNHVIIGASNELGEFESGLTAQWVGPVRAVVYGGVGTLLVVLAWSTGFSSLRRVDRMERPTAGAGTE